MVSGLGVGPFVEAHLQDGCEEGPEARARVSEGLGFRVLGFGFWVLEFGVGAGC